MFALRMFDYVVTIWCVVLTVFALMYGGGCGRCVHSNMLIEFVSGWE